MLTKYIDCILYTSVFCVLRIPWLHRRICTSAPSPQHHGVFKQSLGSVNLVANSGKILHIYLPYRYRYVSLVRFDFDKIILILGFICDVKEIKIWRVCGKHGRYVLKIWILNTVYDEDMGKIWSRCDDADMKSNSKDDNDMMAMWRHFGRYPTSTIFSPTSGSFFCTSEFCQKNSARLDNNIRVQAWPSILLFSDQGGSRIDIIIGCIFCLTFFFGGGRIYLPLSALIGASGQSCLGEWIRFALESQGRGWDVVGRCGNVTAWQSKLTDVFQQVLLFMSFFVGPCSFYKWFNHKLVSYML